MRSPTRGHRGHESLRNTKNSRCVTFIRYGSNENMFEIKTMKVWGYRFIGSWRVCGLGLRLYLMFVFVFWIVIVFSIVLVSDFLVCVSVCLCIALCKFVSTHKA